MGFTGIYPLVNNNNYGKSPLFMGKSTISMVIVHSYVSLPEGILLDYIILLYVL